MTRTPSEPPATAPWTGASLPLRVADLPARHPQPFHLRPDAGARAALAEDLGVTAIRKLEFRGTIAAEGHHDWRLEGVLGASVIQPCIVTGEPVTTRIDQPVIRRFLRRMPQSEEPETEIPEDDTIEPLGPQIDPGAVMTEALALALPDYPRSPGAALDLVEFPPPDQGGPDPEKPENPFARLAGLKQSGDPDSGN